MNIKDIVMKGNWRALDQAIFQAEEAEARRKEAEEERLENFFDDLHRKQLSKKPISSMDWSEIHELNEIRKDSMNTREHAPNGGKSNIDDKVEKPQLDDEENETMEEKFSRAESLCAVIESHERASPDIKNEISNIRRILNEQKQKYLDKPEPSSEEPEEISNEPNISVSKSWEMIQISKSGDLISGFVSSSVTDRQGHNLAMQVLKDALPEYLEHASIDLQHSERVIGKVVKHQFRTINNVDALWVQVKLFSGNEDVINMIADKKLTGFSIYGQGTMMGNTIMGLKLQNIALVNFPANPLAVITEVS